VRVNEVRVRDIQKAEAKALTVVAVAVDAGQAAEAPGRVLTLLGDQLAAIDGPKLIVLPPLLANVLVVPELARSRSLAAAVRRAGRSRWSRRMAIWFTYPHANRRRRPWLVMHDAVHAALRTQIAGLAITAQAPVIGGTTLLSHPRTHWEAWPDHGELFHTAWSFGQDGEPYDVIRQPRCHASVLADAGIDGSDELVVRVLHTTATDVTPVWGDTRPAAPVAWVPQLSGEGDPPLDLGEALASVPGARIAVRSALTGRLGQPLTGQAAVAVPSPTGDTTIETAPEPTADTPATWVARTIELPVDHVCEEPSGAH
jgi:hypothetical protein